MEGDGADAREEGGGRGAASDAGEGDDCGDMTFVGRTGTVERRASMGSEGTVKEGRGVIGRRERELTLLATIATLVSAVLSHWPLLERGERGDMGGEANRARSSSS